MYVYVIHISGILHIYWLNEYMYVCMCKVKWVEWVRSVDDCGEL